MPALAAVMGMVLAGALIWGLGSRDGAEARNPAPRSSPLDGSSGSAPAAVEVRILPKPDLPSGSAMQGSPAGPAVSDALTDPAADEVVRHDAAVVLRESQPEAFLRIALRIIADRDRETDRMRSWMVQHVGIMLRDGCAGSQESLAESVLMACLDDPGWETRRECLWALAVLQSHAVDAPTEALLAGADPSMLDHAIRVAVQRDRRDLAPRIWPHLTVGENAPATIAAIRAVVAWGGAAQAEQLRDLCRDRRPLVAEAAQLALAEMEEL